MAHRIPFAVGPDGLPRSVADVVRGKKCACTCPKCNSPLAAHKGEKNTWHFSHLAHSQCSGALESSLHLAVKAVVERHKQLFIPPCVVYLFHPDHASPIKQGLGIGEYAHDLFKYTHNPTFHDYWREKGAGKGMHPATPQLIKFDSVVLEQTEGNIRPDIVGIAGTRKLYIEVAVTHFIDHAKMLKLVARSVPTIELVVPFIEKAEFSWDALKDWLFNGVEGKYWVLNPRVERLAQADSVIQTKKLVKKQAQEEKNKQEKERKKRWFEEQRRIEREAKMLQQIADEEAEAVAAENRAREKALAEVESKKQQEKKQEQRKKEQEVLWQEELARMMDDAREDDKERALEKKQELARREAYERAIAALDGKPSPDLPTSGMPVLFLDYDSAIQPGSTKEQARLKLLADALKGKLCSVVITSRIRDGLTPSELAVRLTMLGGRHVSATPVLDPDDSFGARQLEIKTWLQQHRISEICIVDGSKHGMPDGTIWVSTRYGLMQEHVQQIQFKSWR